MLAIDRDPGIIQGKLAAMYGGERPKLNKKGDLLESVADFEWLDAFIKRLPPEFALAFIEQFGNDVPREQAQESVDVGNEGKERESSRRRNHRFGPPKIAAAVKDWILLGEEINTAQRQLLTNAPEAMYNTERVIRFFEEVVLAFFELRKEELEQQRREQLEALEQLRGPEVSGPTLKHMAAESTESIGSQLEETEQDLVQLASDRRGLETFIRKTKKRTGLMEILSSQTDPAQKSDLIQ